MTEAPRVPLYDRIPEIYRSRDAEQVPAYPLRAFLGLVEGAFGEVHANVEALYHDLFIDTCDPWVIPYLADLLGTSHLKGEVRTLRRYVAGTIGWRRRKGTLGAIEDLTEALTGWGAFATELFRDLAWAQHLNHPRPDAGGFPPYGLATVDRHTVVSGGTAVIRDPATLTLLDTPFDPLARLPDFRPAGFGSLRVNLPNLPNLAIFLWRLAAYRVGPVRPVHRGTEATGAAGDLAARAVRFDLHPLGDPVALFNAGGLEDDPPPHLSPADLEPGPIHPARLDSPRPPLHRGPDEPAAPGVGDLWLDTTGDGAWRQWNGAAWITLDEPVVDALVGGGHGSPEAYVEVAVYDPDADPDADPGAGAPRVSDLALQLHLPEAAFEPFDPVAWRFRGADLMGWERGLRPPLREREVAVDPRLGRVVVGVASAAQADALALHLRVVHTYGAVGPVGAHPVDRAPSTAATRTVDGTAGNTLEDALADLHQAVADVVVEISDDAVHDLDPATVSGQVDELGGATLRLAHSLTVRAADGKRPIVRLAAPLRFRALDAERAGRLRVALSGLYLTRGPGWADGDALIARADLGSLSLDGCTLDPGGALPACEALGRGAIHPGMRLADGDTPLSAARPQVSLRRTVSGPLRIDRGYRLELTASIVDAGSGVGEDPATAGFAVTGAADPPEATWGPELTVDGATLFGRVRVERASGKGGIFAQACEVLRNQGGCLKQSWFTGRGDRLPQTHACVRGTGENPAALRFVSEIFGRPGYGQLAFSSDFRVRERGPGDDAMGAFGFLLESHKWHNLEIRYREFMPVGVRPLLIPVT